MEFLWTGWTPLVHSAIIVVAGYAVLVLLLRITGARTMARMTPLDFVLAVTIGSAFGRTITASEVALAHTLFVVTLLIGIQWIIAVGRARWVWVRRAVDNPPVLLWYDGVMVTASLRRHRLTEVDVHTAARQAGHGSLEHLTAVIMQQDGVLGVIAKGTLGDGSSVLPYVAGVALDTGAPADQQRPDSGGMDATTAPSDGDPDGRAQLGG
ncbi:MAG: YetF domain-containing protein [Ornithinimicrobium sp.]